MDKLTPNETICFTLSSWATPLRPIGVDVTTMTVILYGLQFYTGRDHMLYEVVIFTAGKNSISGYLSTPKNAPTPVTP